MSEEQKRNKASNIEVLSDWLGIIGFIAAIIFLIIAFYEYNQISTVPYYLKQSEQRIANNLEHELNMIMFLYCFGGALVVSFQAFVVCKVLEYLRNNNEYLLKIFTNLNNE